MKSNFNLLIGENKEGREFNLYNILNNINYDDNNKIEYDMNVNGFHDVIEEAAMISLFSSIKVIIVNNFDLDSVNDVDFELLNKFIESKNSDVYIIIIANKIDARKKNYKIFKDNFNIIDVDKINNNIYDYIDNKIKDNGYKIDSYNIEYLLSRTGNDINNINNELDKLFVYKLEEKKILKEDIDLLIFDNIDNVIYEFTNAILDDDYDKIKYMYDKFMLDNISFEYLLSTVASSFRTCLIIKLLYNKNMSNFEIAKILNKKEYFVKKSLDRLYRYSLDDLKKYINDLAVIDRNFKMGYDNVGRFELFLFSRN